MTKISLRKIIEKLWKTNNSAIILFFLITIFFLYATFIAFNTKSGIITDENTHFNFSKRFSTTLGIPPDVPDTYSLGGTYIKQHPFLYYWINGRIINLIKIIIPSVTDWQLLICLRMINVFYSVGTVFYLYLFSKELIKHKWWQLMPVFLLTNTIMFVFLSGGVNYDNLTNLFCMAGLFYFVRLLNRRAFLVNSLGWMICIASAALTKFTALPLALGLTVAWSIYLIKNVKRILPININDKKIILLGLVLILLISGNLAIYGYNLIRYHAILPPCEAILTIEQCQISPFAMREERLSLDQKLSLVDATKLGYPGPIRYLFLQWIPNMFSRIYGITGPIIYYNDPATYMHLMLFYIMIIITIVFWRDFSFTNLSLLGIFLFYAIVLFIKNYDIELSYGFKDIALNGRYVFPVIGIAYTFITKVMKKIPNNLVRIPMLVYTLIFYIVGGPAVFFLLFDQIFSEWFIR